MLVDTIVKDGATNDAYLRVIKRENYIERRNVFNEIEQLEHVTTSYVLQIKVKGIIMSRYVPIKSWIASADDEEELEFIKNEAIELFNHTINPYKNYI